MAQTAEGVVKAMKTIRERHGVDFHKKMGAKGGKATGVKKGFAANPQLARMAGRIGGAHRRMQPRVRIAKQNAKGDFVTWRIKGNAFSSYAQADAFLREQFESVGRNIVKGEQIYRQTDLTTNVDTFYKLVDIQK